MTQSDLILTADSDNLTPAIHELKQFHLDLPARSQALDLGTSPSGWTRVLRQKANNEQQK